MALRIRNVTFWMIGIIILVYILQAIFGEGFTGSLALTTSQVLAKPWLLLTSMFLHAGITHLIFNLYALFLFGPLLERRIGPGRWLLVYFVSGILAGVIFSLIYPQSVALGASGAIMGIIGALIIIWPDLRLLLFFAIPMPLWIAGIIFALIDIFGIIFPAGVANVAHLAGLAIGLGFGLLFKEQKKRYQRKFSGKRHLSNEDVAEYLRTGRM